jgi:squalene synthase HpnC
VRGFLKGHRFGMPSPEFLEELRRYGPPGWSGAASPPGNERVTAEFAAGYCRRLATTHYENFPLVSWMLPQKLHQDFFNVYAYCRWADDLGDEVGDPAKSLKLLGWWRSELQECYAGRASHPVFIALGKTIKRHAIPCEPFEHLIQAFEQDQRLPQYQTFEEVLGYCRNSADPVGRLVLYLVDAANETNFRWSDSICTGLQLANFWQDVARDADIGRRYLPLEDCQRFGYSEADWQQRVTNDAFLKLMEFQVARAESYLRTGLPLVDVMPGRVQVDIDLFVAGGLKILQKVRQIGFRVWETRPKVTKIDAAWMLLAAVGRYGARQVMQPFGSRAQHG